MAATTSERVVHLQRLQADTRRRPSRAPAGRGRGRAGGRAAHQLSCRRYDQGPEPVHARPPCAVEPLEQRHQECQRLAGSGARATLQIAGRQRVRDRGALDLRHVREAALLQPAQRAVRQRQLGECARRAGDGAAGGLPPKLGLQRRSCGQRRPREAGGTTAAEGATRSLAFSPFLAKQSSPFQPQTAMA